MDRPRVLRICLEDPSPRCGCYGGETVRVRIGSQDSGEPAASFGVG